MDLTLIICLADHVLEIKETKAVNPDNYCDSRPLLFKLMKNKFKTLLINVEKKLFNLFWSISYGLVPNYLCSGSHTRKRC